MSLTGTSTASGSISSDGGSYTFSGLTAGTYSIIVQDANFVSSPSGCDVTTESLIINEPEELIISNLSEHRFCVMPMRPQLLPDLLLEGRPITKLY